MGRDVDVTPVDVTKPGRNTLQTVGLMMWRGGLLFVAGYSLWRGARVVVRHLEIAVQLEVGLSLALTGLILVFASLIMERMRERRREGDLSDEVEP